MLVCLIGAEFLVIGALDLLFVVMAVDVLDAGAAWAGYLNTAYGAGALVFGALAALLIGRRLGPVVLATAVVLGLALAASTISGLAVVMVLLAVVGGTRALLDVSVRVLLQRTVPPHRLAGVFGVAEGLLMIGLAAGSLLVPFLMSLGGATLALLGTAAILPALVLAFLPAAHAAGPACAGPGGGDLAAPPASALRAAPGDVARGRGAATRARRVRARRGAGARR